MNTWRFVGGLLVMIGTVGSSSAQSVSHFFGPAKPSGGGQSAVQPETDFRDAVNRLVDAGNYSWQESFEDTVVPLTPNRRNAAPTGEGETNVSGYTMAVIQRRHVVLGGAEAALKMAAGWRLANDLTDEEVGELNQWQWSPRTEAAKAKRARHYTHAVPHEVLLFLLQTATNFRLDGAAIAADAAVTQEDLKRLDSFLFAGVSRHDGIARSSLEAMSSRSQNGRNAAAHPLAPEEWAVLYVTLVGGMIEEFSVEYTRSGRVPVKGAPTETAQLMTVYTMKLSKVGTTKVEVDSEVKALLLNATNGP